MQQPRMRDLEYPEHDPANDNLPDKAIGASHWRRTSSKRPLVISSLLSLTIISCLIGMVALASAMRWL